MSRTELRIRFAEEAPEEARQRYRELVKQRAEGCPVAYLVGRKEFYLLDFEVSPAVLIPRDEEARLQELREALARRYDDEGVTLALTGPWPPYTFAR